MRKIITSLLAVLALASCSGGGEAPRYKDPKQSVEVRVQDLLKRMTLDEKIAQMRHIHSYAITTDGRVDLQKLRESTDGLSFGCIEGFTFTGREYCEAMNQVQRYMRDSTRLGIPLFTVAESLHGVVQDGSTIFPQSIAVGSTFNPELSYRMSCAISEELKGTGVSQVLGPVLDVARDLRWGRVEECFSEDPFLVTLMGYNSVKGYMDSGICPMLKHFGAHAQPTGGLNLSSVACGERELLSVHLKPFEVVVKELHPMAVMSSYNSWNNIPNSSSHYLMTELLRDQWGFRGYVYSDWGATGMLSYFHKTAQNQAVAAIQALTAGLDLEASASCYTELKQLVENGVLDVKYIDLAVERILRAKFAAGLFEAELPDPADYDKSIHTEAHIALAREIAEESVVLVKNEKNALPLDINKIRSIALVGPNADQVQFGDYTWSRSNSDGVTLAAALKEQYGGRLQINYAKGCDMVTDNKAGFADAVAASRRSDVTVVMVGSASASLSRDYTDATCGEGFDLSDIELTGVQEELIRAVHATGKPVVVVLLSGKPFAMPWVKENIPAIVVQWYPGEQGGNALADVLFGKVNPSGKLNYSFPQSTGTLPCYYNYLPTDKGYYKRPGTPNHPGKDYVFSSPAPLWAFGHGLSYTGFDYVAMETSKENYGVSDTIEVTVTVANEGAYDGKEAVQLYVRHIFPSVATPVHELKGLNKVLIKKGETVQVKILVPVASLAIYDRAMNYVVEPGSYELQVGRASDDIRIKQVVTIEKEKIVLIPTAKERETPQAAAPVASTPVTVTGIVRDVQANPQKGITVRAGGREFVTGPDGAYKLQAMSTDTITFAGSSLRTEVLPIRGRQVINVKMSFGE